MSGDATEQGLDVASEVKQYFADQAKDLLEEPFILREGAVFPRREFERLIQQAGLVPQIAELFCKNQFYSKHTEQIAELVKEYIQTYLPEILYIVTGETIIKALAYASGEKPSKTKMRALTKEVARLIQRRDRKLILRDGRGAPLKWDKRKLETSIRRAMRGIKNPRLLTQKKVIELINNIYSLKTPLTITSLVHLMKRNGVNWKGLKAQRLAELRKLT